MAFRQRTLWIIWILVVGLVTTLPWSGLQGHSHWDNVRRIPFYAESLSLRFLFDIAVNLLLLLPFGYLYVRSQVAEPRAVFLRITLLAALLSAGAELAQVFSHNRIPSMTNICTNVIGAAMGAVIAKRWIKKCAIQVPMRNHERRQDAKQWIP